MKRERRCWKREGQRTHPKWRLYIHVNAWHGSLKWKGSSKASYWTLEQREKWSSKRPNEIGNNQPMCPFNSTWILATGAKICRLCMLCAHLCDGFATSEGGQVELLQGGLGGIFALPNGSGVKSVREAGGLYLSDGRERARQRGRRWRSETW